MNSCGPVTSGYLPDLKTSCRQASPPRIDSIWREGSYGMIYEISEVLWSHNVEQQCCELFLK